MDTKIFTMCISENSVLDQQFNDSKLTQQGFDCMQGMRMPDEVNNLTKSIGGVLGDIIIILKKNKITGQELLSLSVDGLKMM